MKYPLYVIMIICLVVTLFTEILMACILKTKNKKDYLNIILVNTLTNPLVVTIPFYINIKYGLKYRNLVLYILEILAVVLEGYIYQKYLTNKKMNPYLFSLILNISSYIVGLIVNYIIY